MTVCTRVCVCVFKLVFSFCAQDVYGVIVGGLLGHFLCTGLAVIGGRIIATKISVRTGKISFSSLCKFVSQSSKTQLEDSLYQGPTQILWII